MEKDLIESNEKVKQLCETISRLELKLKDVNNKLELSNTKCDQLSEDYKKLQSTEDDLSKQVRFKNEVYYYNIFIFILYLMFLGMFLIAK